MFSAQSILKSYCFDLESSLATVHHNIFLTLQDTLQKLKVWDEASSLEENYS